MVEQLKGLFGKKIGIERRCRLRRIQCRNIAQTTAGIVKRGVKGIKFYAIPQTKPLLLIGK